MPHDKEKRVPREKGIPQKKTTPDGRSGRGKEVQINRKKGESKQTGVVHRPLKQTGSSRSSLDLGVGHRSRFARWGEREKGREPAMREGAVAVLNSCC